MKAFLQPKLRKINERKHLKIGGIIMKADFKIKEYDFNEETIN